MVERERMSYEDRRLLEINTQEAWAWLRRMIYAGMAQAPVVWAQLQTDDPALSWVLVAIGAGLLALQMLACWWAVEAALEVRRLRNVISRHE